MPEFDIGSYTWPSFKVAGDPDSQTFSPFFSVSSDETRYAFKTFWLDEAQSLLNSHDFSSGRLTSIR